MSLYHRASHHTDEKKNHKVLKDACEKEDVDIKEQRLVSSGTESR